MNPGPGSGYRTILPQIIMKRNSCSSEIPKAPVITMPAGPVFVPASRHGLRCEWDVPDEAFMVHVLDPAATAAAAGLIRYRPEFLMEMPG